MRHFLLRIIQTIENAPLTLASFVTAFFALIITRILIEASLRLFQQHTFFFYFFEFTHTFLFFLCSFLLLVFLVRYAGKTTLKQASNVLLFGFLIILTPPIIDTLMFHGGSYWSFYAFDGFSELMKRYISFFGNNPDMGITYGVRVEVALVTLALGLYTFLKSQQWKKSFFVSFLTYTILFVLGTFPAWLTLGILFFQKSFLAINANDVAGLFLTPESIFSQSLADFRSVLNVKMSIIYSLLATLLLGLMLFREYPKYFWALVKNARPPQIIYHGGLLILGILLAFFFTGAPVTLNFFHIAATLCLLFAVESAWMASVIANDCFDIDIDSLSNQSRPLIVHALPENLYWTFGIIFFIVSLLFSGVVSFSALLLLLGYQAIAWIYSAPPLRLKRYPIVATLLAAFAGVVVLVLGFLVVAPDKNLNMLPLPLLFYLLLAYALCLPIKDFKDMAGDARDHIYTIPVLLGAKKAQLLIGSLTFLLYAFSPLVLHAQILFFPAIFFGSIAFWMIQKGEDRNDSYFSFRELPSNILILTVLYGLTLVALLF